MMRFGKEARAYRNPTAELNVPGNALNALTINVHPSEKSIDKAGKSLN